MKSCSVIFLTALICLIPFEDGNARQYPDKHKYVLHITPFESKQKSPVPAFLLSNLVPFSALVLSSELENEHPFYAGLIKWNGLLAGPSTGRLYAGDTEDLLLSLGIRTTGFVMRAVGKDWWYDAFKTEDKSSFQRLTGYVMYFGGPALIIFSYLYDIISPAYKIYQDNKRIRVIPYVDSGSGAALLSLRLNF